MRIRVLAMVAALIASNGFALETWKIDPDHSSARFQVRHLMISNVSGEITGINGKFLMNGDDVKSLTVEATLDMKTLTTHHGKRDEHLRSDDFFSTNKFPTMKFKSKKITDVAGDTFKVVGDLTIRDKTKEVTLDSKGFSATVKDPWGNTKRGFLATTTINRKDWGIVWNKTLDGGGVAVGDDVNVTIELELQRDLDAKPKKS
jgi:polyisoprenoid-binding protein YceI